VLQRSIGIGTGRRSYAIGYAAYCLHASLETVLQRQAGLSDPLAYIQQDRMVSMILSSSGGIVTRLP
jgi:hypothetical protein